MKSKISLSALGFGLIFITPVCGIAQTTTTSSRTFTIQHNDPNNEVLCRTPGRENLPQCQNRQSPELRDPFNNNNERRGGHNNREGERHSSSFYSPDSNKASVANYRKFNLINIPNNLVKPDLPPYWMKICRPWPSPERSNDYISSIDILIDNNPKIKINDRGCTFVPFTQSIVVSTISSIELEFEYQFLGRA